MSHPVRRGLAAVVWLAVAHAGCGEAPVLDPHPTTLRIALRADVTGFLPGPPMVNESFTLQANRSVYAALVRFDGDLRLQSGLAERWSNPDDRTYRFVLRPGVRFSDGRLLTTEDVVASLEANRKTWVTRDFLQAIESVRSIGDREVEIRTRLPYLALLTRLPWGLVLPSESVGTRTHGAPGTGPYAIEKWEAGRGYVFVRNRYFGGPRPAFDRVVHTVVPSSTARMKLVERGLADAADHVPPDDADRLARDPALRIVSRPGICVLFLCLRVDRPPFSDPRLREAIDLAIDREELARRALSGRAAVANQIVPPSIVGFDPAVRRAGPDLARARALVAEAGHPRGLEVRLDGPRNRYVNDIAVVQEIARQLQRIGVRVVANTLDKRDFFALIAGGGSSMHLVGYSCESGDAGDILGSFLHSPTGTALGSLNSTGIADPELDRLMDEADRARADAERAVRLRRAAARAGALRAALPLVVQTETVVLSRRLAWEPPFNMALAPEDVRPAP